jgi:hypothetical protein
MFFNTRKFFIDIEATIMRRCDEDRGDVGSKALRQGWRWKNV